MEKSIEQLKYPSWVGCDLDGTLAKYDGWPADGSIGEPIGPAVQAVKILLAKGIAVRIVTARVCSATLNDNIPCLDNAEVVKVQRWCEKHIGQKLPVVFWKDKQMVELWDDRAIQMIPNEGIPIVVKSMPVIRIAEKLWHWAMDHGGTAPPQAWEELRNVLGIPKSEKNLIIPAINLPKVRKRG